MLTAQDIGYLVIGIISCLMGYSLFRTMLPLWGFILGGWIAFTFIPSFVHGPNQLLFQVIGFFVAGLLGAVLATPLYFGVIFLTGAALGVIIGTMLGALLDVGGITTIAKFEIFLRACFPPIPHTLIQYGFSLLGAAGLGLLSLNFQKFMIITSSAFLGAAAIMTGLSVSIAQSSRTITSQGAIMLAGLLIIGMVSMFVQFRFTGDV